MAVLRENQIYNTNSTGSPSWDLFSEESVKLENTWNKSIRLMMDAPPVNSILEDPPKLIKLERCYSKQTRHKLKIFSQACWDRFTESVFDKGADECEVWSSSHFKLNHWRHWNYFGLPLYLQMWISSLLHFFHGFHGQLPFRNIDNINTRHCVQDYNQSVLTKTETQTLAFFSLLV